MYDYWMSFRLGTPGIDRSIGLVSAHKEQVIEFPSNCAQVPDSPKYGARKVRVTEAA